MVEEADQRLANRRLGCLTDKPGSKIVQCRESFCLCGSPAELQIQMVAIPRDQLCLKQH
jgi:hypothetical protein